MEAIKVNLIPNGIPQMCHASQYDEGRQIRLDLFDGFTPYVIQSGDTFTLNVRKPDNHVVVETVTGTEGNTYLVIETTEQMTAVMGKNLCEIRVENDGDNIGSLNFIMQVEKDVIANGIPSESVIEDLDALVVEAVGDDFYTKSEVDDLVGGLIDDESTANNKTWSSEKIDEAFYTKAEVNTALGEKASLSYVDSCNDKMGGKTFIDFYTEKTGYINTGTGVINNLATEYGYVIISVKEGDSFSFTTNGVYYGYFGFLSAYNEASLQSTIVGELTRVKSASGTVPSGAIYLYLTVKYNNNSADMNLVLNGVNITEKMMGNFVDLASKNEYLSVNKVGRFLLFNEAPEYDGYINFNGSKGGDSKWKYKVIPVNEGDIISFSVSNNVPVYYAFFSAFDISTGATVVSYHTTQELSAADVVVPTGTKYFYTQTKSSNHDVTFGKMTINDTPIILSVFDSLSYVFNHFKTALNNLAPTVRVSVIGDSISTYGGYMTPSNNRCYYNGEASTDVDDVSKTWWYQVIQRMNWLFEVNNSWAGSFVCNTGYDGGDASAHSFVTRMSEIGRPDIIFIMGGTNDSWGSSPLGNFKYSDWTQSDLNDFRPAFAYMLWYLKSHNPNAKIYNVVNYGLGSDYISSMATICEYFNVDNIVLTDYDKASSHPTAQGMTTIANTILNELQS